MANVAKYLLVLETLDLPEKDSTNSEEHLANLKILRKFIKSDSKDTVKELSDQLQLPQLASISLSVAEEEKYGYAIYLQYLLLHIIKNTNFGSDAKEDLISVRHINLCIAAVQHLSVYSLRNELHQCFCQTGVFVKSTDHGVSPNYSLLRLSVEFFAHVLQIKQLHSANSMETVLRDYMAAIYTLLLAKEDGSEFDWQPMQLKLNYVWLSLSKVDYFRNILLLKSMPKLPAEVQRQLHKELLQKLMTIDGFTTLVATLQIARLSSKESTRRDEKQTFEIVANIISAPGHSKRFQENMIRQIFKFLKLCLRNAAMADSMGAGLLALRRLYDFSNDNQALVREMLQLSLKHLYDPTDVLSGLIVMEHNDFSMMLTWLYHLFCTSTVECLPSTLLVDYLPLLLQIYQQLPVSFVPKKQLAALILRCLHNRSESELSPIIEKLYTLKYDTTWKRLHERILFLPSETQTEVTVKITSPNFKQDLSISLALPELLVDTEHHLLTYRIFMVLLRIMSSSSLMDVENRTIDLLQTKEELIEFLNANYPVKVELLLSLNALIAHPPLRAQIAANSTEFLQFLGKLLEKRIRTPHTTSTESSDQMLLLLLTLTQEMLEHAQLPDCLSESIPTLKQLRTQSPNQLVQQRATELIALLSGDLKAHKTHNNSDFLAARTLIESAESHLQVYGIQLLIDLLRRRDTTTLGQTHVVVALALSTLRKPESYTFLNCVRLFVALVNIAEVEETVLDILVDEYLSDTAPMDFRLVVGEAILKVCKELGPLCFKHKRLLLNCFMQGARSNVNEFRMSAFANLAQMCRILSFQVQNFIQELLNLIDCELTTSKYLPAQRAAVLVLNELLAGMEELSDYEEMLLPVYRLLRSIESDQSCDAKMRLHAANGLKILAEKCHKFLFPTAQEMQQEIKIFNIHDKVKSKNLKPHILEIN